MFEILTSETVVLFHLCFALLTGLYLLSFLVTKDLECTPSAFNVPAHLRECIGVLVRRQRNLPSVPGQVDALAWFKLGSTASEDDVDQAANLLFGGLFGSHFWAYPPSQHRLLKRHVRRARGTLAFYADAAQQSRTASARERRRVERAEAHRATQQGSIPGPQQERRGREAPAARVPRPATGWRRVLGLEGVETDPAVIKKAYRKRVSAAHPDRGGSTEQAAQLNDAFAEARQELAFV